MLRSTIIASAMLIVASLDLAASQEQQSSVNTSTVKSQCKRLSPNANTTLDPVLWTVHLEINNTGVRAKFFGEKSSALAILIHRQAAIGHFTSLFGIQANDIEAKIREQIYTASKVIRNKSASNYIIVVLSKPVNLNENVKPLPLPAVGITFAGCSCLHTVIDPDTGVVINTRRVEVVSDKKCNSGNFESSSPIWRKQICVFFTAKEESFSVEQWGTGSENQLVCPVRDSNSQYVLASVWAESIDTKKTDDQYIAGFSSMGRDVEWITKQIENLNSKVHIDHNYIV